MVSDTIGQTGPRMRLFGLLHGYIAPQLVYVAAKLGIADVLRDGPQPFRNIAAAVVAEPDALRRIVRGLVSIGVLCEEWPDVYRLEAMGHYLVTGGSQSLRDIAILQGEEMYQAWGDLLYSVQTGRPAFEHAHGAPFFAYMDNHPEVDARFNNFMADTGHRAANAVRDAYDFAGVQTVVDVGGGTGVLLAAVLAANPHVRGILFDRAADAAGSHAVLVGAGVAERCATVRGDFFTSVPRGGDLYILSQIMHNWDDAHACRILCAIRAAMSARARLLLFEHVMPEGGAGKVPIEQDMLMLVLTGGRERTAGEYAALLAETGFGLARIIPTRHARSLIEAVPVAIESGGG